MVHLDTVTTKEDTLAQWFSKKSSRIMASTPNLYTLELAWILTTASTNCRAEIYQKINHMQKKIQITDLDNRLI